MSERYNTLTRLKSKGARKLATKSHKLDEIREELGSQESAPVADPQPFLGLIAPSGKGFRGLLSR